MKLGILTAFWKRWELSQIFLDYWTAFSMPGVDIVRAASYSYDGNDWKGALSSRGWRHAQVPNLPLGRKLNRALPLLDDCDVVMALGSDDFTSKGWVRYGCKRMEHTQMFGTSATYVFAPAISRLVYVRGAKIGAGRFYHREILEAVDWSLWNNGKSRALDASAQQRINWAVPGWTGFEWIEDIRAKNLFLVDVKAGDPEQKSGNIWGFYDVLNVHGDSYDCEPALLDRYLGKQTAERIRQCL